MSLADLLLDLLFFDLLDALTVDLDDAMESALESSSLSGAELLLTVLSLLGNTNAGNASLMYSCHWPGLLGCVFTIGAGRVAAPDLNSLSVGADAIRLLEYLNGLEGARSVVGGPGTAAQELPEPKAAGAGSVVPESRGQVSVFSRNARSSNLTNFLLILSNFSSNASFSSCNCLMKLMAAAALWALSAIILSSTLFGT
jgi:hypothetical protein